MKNYRKKPVVIQAEQYFLDKEIEHVKKLDKPIKVGDVTFVAEIKTLEDTENSTHYVRETDYIIIGVEGEVYSCREDIFNKTYELVEEI